MLAFCVVVIERRWLQRNGRQRIGLTSKKESQKTKIEGISLPKPNVESEGVSILKAKNPDRQRALVLVVRKGAVPAMLLCDALLCGVARQRIPYKGGIGSVGENNTRKVALGFQ